VTLVIGVNLGEYAVVAGDSRETVFTEVSAEVTAVEGFEKVRPTPVGLATGSGITRAVFGAIEDFTKDAAEVRDSTFITDYLRDFMPAFVREASKRVTDPRLVPQLGRAGWILTSVERGRLHVRLYHSDSAFSPDELDEEAPLVLLPLDMTAKQSLPLELDLMNELCACHSESTVATSLGGNLAAIVRFFRRASAMSVHLGVGLQVGIHHRGGHVEVQPIRPLSDFA